MNLLTAAVWAKDNPLIAVSGVLAGIAAGAVTLDARYAKAAEMAQQSAQITTALEVNRLTAEVSVLEIRRSTLQDRVDDAAVRKARSVEATVIANRNATELRDIERQIAEKRILIDKLRTGR